MGDRDGKVVVKNYLLLMQPHKRPAKLTWSGYSTGFLPGVGAVSPQAALSLISGRTATTDNSQWLCFFYAD